MRVKNADDRPIYDLKWQPGWLVCPFDNTAFEDVKVSFQPPTRMMEAGGEHRVDVLDTSVRHLSLVRPVQRYLYLPAMTFEDDDGYLFCWDNDPLPEIMQNGRVTGTWSPMDDNRKDYPADQPAFREARELRPSAVVSEPEVESLDGEPNVETVEAEKKQPEGEASPLVDDSADGTTAG
ncbi:hypothetical protein GCM10011588_27140 [Nocardia jinanensis]|uniref:Uncharacterized protein n=1 Tax=Nocardia jinanensis TaxID=382504 RepID=A0A917RK79_9NOCA|nr:hypothetical protein GCM10011588_27140 [Nocardia jinanensis]